MPLPYSKKVIQHFNKPHNYGKMRNPDGVGQVGNMVCGDVMKLYIKVAQNKKGQDIIKDIKFATFGCLAAIASSSMLTDLVKGKTLEQAVNFNREEIVKELGGLPPIKVHCSVLAGDALIEAIHDYLIKNKKLVPKALNERHIKLAKEKQEIEKTHQAC